MAEDSVSVIALLVSLVALIVTFLQVIQQYASTAYDYRRCSKRTMGGWAKETKRHFIWSEIRFEIIFAVPHIDIQRSWDLGPTKTVEKYAVKNAPLHFSLPPGEPVQQTISAAILKLTTNWLNVLRLKSSKILRNSQRALSSTAIAKTITKWLPTLHSESLRILNSLQPSEPGSQAVFSREPEHTDWEGPQPRKDWYLSLLGAVPEAACSWLRLLHDSQSTNLYYKIITKRLTFDYLPRDVTRPLATAERSAFLAILTVLGTEWKDRGAEGIFVGQSLSNDIEVTMANIPSVGIVYSYDRSPEELFPLAARMSNYQSQITSLSCMFNKFGLIGFYSDILTWSKDEIRQSLTTTLGDTVLAEHLSKQYKLNGLNIGIGELIAGWSSTLSMPQSKHRIHSHVFSQRNFSASSLGCTFGMPLLAATLCINMKILVRHNLDQNVYMMKFTEMIKGYYAFLKAKQDYGQGWLDKLLKCLEWASRVRTRSNILFRYWYFVTPDLEECYNLMADEKNGLDNAEASHTSTSRWDWDEKLRRVGIALLKAYSKQDPALMQGPVEDNVDSWIREAVLLTATAAVEALEELSQQDPTGREIWQNIIINRIIRGMVWTIHNGKAPGWDFLTKERDRPPGTRDRSLECSLSSRWLDEPGIVYIS